MLGKLLVGLSRLFPPKSVERKTEDQVKIDLVMKSHTLYIFETCPFCIKVFRHMKRLNIQVEQRDARKKKRFAKELKDGGGKIQVPCLRIESANQVTWMYESTDINQYFDDLVKKLVGP